MFGAATARSSHSSNKELNTEQDIILLLKKIINGVKKGIHLKPLCNFWDYDSSCHSEVQKSHCNLDIRRPKKREVICSHKEGVTTTSFSQFGLRVFHPPSLVVAMPLASLCCSTLEMLIDSHSFPFFFLSRDFNLLQRLDCNYFVHIYVYSSSFSSAVLLLPIAVIHIQK